MPKVNRNHTSFMTRFVSHGFGHRTFTVEKSDSVNKYIGIKFIYYFSISQLSMFDGILIKTHVY